METAVILKSLFQTSTSLTYSESSNSFLTNGYISRANNTHFNAFRFAEGIIIREHVGVGYAHTFLNGISIYHLDSRQLIADRCFRSYFYSKEAVIYESCKMLLELLQQASTKEGKCINLAEAKTSIEKLIRNSFNQNQVELANNESRRLLNS